MPERTVISAFSQHTFSGQSAQQITFQSSQIVALKEVLGCFPEQIGHIQDRSLRRLHFGENNLTRESSSTELRFFYSLTNCRDLQVLEISLNQFNGVLPAIVGNLSTSLRIFAAFNSRIKGQIDQIILIGFNSKQVYLNFN